MSAVHGVPPWPAQVAGGAAAGQAGQLPSSAAPGLTRTPISQQSLQQLANACAGFRPPPNTARVGVRQQQRCYLQPHVVQGLCTLSVMLGADRTTALSDFRPGRDHTQGDQVLRPPFPGLRERRGCARVCARMAHVDCMQLGDMQLADGPVMIVLCSKRASQRFSRSWGRASCWCLTARGSVPCSCKRELHAAQAEAQRCGLGWTASRRFGGAASEGLGDSCSRVECRGSGGRSRCAGSALSV